MNRDRTLHGKTRDGLHIARYDRAGKWYVEEPGKPRRKITVGEAAELAFEGEAYAKRPGGERFDSLVAKLEYRHYRRWDHTTPEAKAWAAGWEAGREILMPADMRPSGMDERHAYYCWVDFNEWKDKQGNDESA